ncbi:MAG: bifunctional (p)ppGpp synthetase/guanosine-3',5'-bis(diphosphate) 3'-pyrophosphohydrolase [Deltaproteobacteria bacterium]|nr:bifunctional (p)ppGpp synthetase/guanosine-3',5'-bis(diphosphate) 3'-pyrophosphohydrolase [Deltaproteobacteria bacterium]
MLRLNDIVDKFLAHHPDADVDLIKKAYVYSAKVHAGQVRKSGEPYLVHPLEVAGLLADLKLDAASICTGLLHDTVEDTLATLEEVETLFGKDVRELVDGVTKLSQISFTTREEKLAENFRKMLIAMARDIRVILIKLADRLHNMRTLAFMSPDKQEKIAQETQDIYAPLANRLGIQWIKVELEDLAFMYLKPREHQEISDSLGQTSRERGLFIEKVVAIIRDKLQGTDCEKSEIYGREKNLYSIYKKMIGKNVNLEDIHDLVAFRIIVDDVAQCYEALGLMHALWRPIPGRFKDYIAMPKPNMYQSLHTTVSGPEGERVEIQIRTREMHEIAEEGIAAHWKYKETGSLPTSDKTDRSFAWLRQLLDWQKELTDPGEFLESVKVDLFSDEVYVFTPRGDVMELPRGSTPVDFAYSIHSDVGNHCSGAKVNGKIVPLRYQLHNGDAIEIFTNPNQKPNKDWLSFVRTSRARNKVRAVVRAEQRQRSLDIGRELLERELKRFGLSLQRVTKDKSIERAFKDGKYNNAEELLVGIGYGKINPASAVERMLPEDKRIEAKDDKAKEPEKAPDQAQSRLGKLLERVTRRGSSASSGVKIEGIEDMLVRYARCCHPVPGDDVVGYITRGRGITVHRADCDKARELDSARRVKVSWDTKVKQERNISLKIITEEREGMLADLTQAFTKSAVNITQANCKVVDKQYAINTFEIGIDDLDHLKKLVKSIEAIKGVHSVERVRS